MPGEPGILIDINIILAVLQRREPFYEPSVRPLALVETGQVQGYLAATA